MEYTYMEHFGLSKFELIWLSLTGLYIIKGACDFFEASGLSCNRDFSGDLGWFRCKKRSVCRWVIGVGVTSLVVFSIYRCYITSVPAYGWISSVVDYFGSPTTNTTDYMSTTIASTMLLINLIRRGHHAIFHSVNSDSTQSVLDAITPLLYNITAAFVLLSAAPRLNVAPTESWLHFSSLKFTHILGVVVLLLSNYLDSQCQESLLKCRKNKAGHIVTDEHKIPRGGLFELVSSPLFFLEILNNLTIGMTLGLGHRPWWILTAYVIVSHVTRALDRQRWFHKKFETYPCGRNVIVPYVF